MKYLNFSFFLLMAGILTGTASCNREEMNAISQGGSVSESRGFILEAYHKGTAGPERNKTVLDVADGSVLWHRGDALKLITENGVFTSCPLSLDEDVSSAVFEFENVTGEPAYTVYPAATAAIYDGTDLTVTIPSVQDGTFAGAAIEVAAVDGDNPIALQNLGGLFQLVIDNEDVRKIVLTSNASESLTGEASVSFDDEGVPQITSVTDGSSSIVATISGAGTWYLATLPVTMAEGLCVELFDENDQLIADRYMISGNCDQCVSIK